MKVTMILLYILKQLGYADEMQSLSPRCTQAFHFKLLSFVCLDTCMRNLFDTITVTDSHFFGVKYHFRGMSYQFLKLAMACLYTKGQYSPCCRM